MLHEEIYDEMSTKYGLKIRLPFIYLWLSELHFVDFLIEFIGLAVVLNIECGVVDLIYRYSPISFMHVNFMVLLVFNHTLIKCR